jgi:predicted RNase H-like HicB family nuclease
MLSQYIAAAMRRAVIRWLDEEQTWYGEISGLDGVWTTGESEAACRDELQEVLEEWLALGLRLGHDLPEIDGVTVTVGAVE